MATSLLALLDDIASVLDDVATLTKVATTKTAGVLGDDLALNAQQVSGVRADRELPVVWAVAKGSLVNKAILVPAALAISAIRALGHRAAADRGWALPLLRGFRKARPQIPAQQATTRPRGRAELAQALLDPAVDLVALEKDKIKGAIRTDFILSAEIIVITLGTVAGAAFGTRVTVLVGIALLMTVGVYGLVAGIVKLDDGGLLLTRAAGDTAGRVQARARARHPARRAVADEGAVGRRHRSHVPGRRRHPHARHPAAARGDRALARWFRRADELLGPLLIDAMVGVIAGALVLAIVSGVKRLRGAPAAHR